MFKKLLNIFKGSGDKFPDEMPAGFKIEISGGGTFVRSYVKVLIEENNFHIHGSAYGFKQEYHTTSFSRSDLERLFHLLKENKFDRIKTRETLRNDYPAFFITASWKDKCVSKGESQTTEMSNEDYEIFHACEFYLYKTLDEILKNSTKSIHVIPDKILLDETQGSFMIESSGRLFPYFFKNWKDSYTNLYKPFPNELTVLPGYTVVLFAKWKNEYSYDGAPPQYVISIPQDIEYKTLHIYEEEEKLKWRFEP